MAGRIQHTGKCLDGGGTGQLYPLLTAPLAGKGPDSVVCPEPHVARLKEFLKDCLKFLVIGTSGLDTDLLHLVSDAPPGGHAVFVGKGGKVDVEAVAKRFLEGGFRVDPQPTVYHRGFANFVQSGTLEEFAKR